MDDPDHEPLRQELLDNAGLDEFGAEQEGLILTSPPQDVASPPWDAALISPPMAAPEEVRVAPSTTPAVPPLVSALRRMIQALWRAAAVVHARAATVFRQPAWCEALSPAEIRTLRGLIVFLAVVAYSSVVIGIWNWSVASDRRRALTVNEVAHQRPAVPPPVPVATPQAPVPSAPIESRSPAVTPPAPGPATAAPPFTIPITATPAPRVTPPAPVPPSAETPLSTRAAVTSAAPAPAGRPAAAAVPTIQAPASSANQQPAPSAAVPDRGPARRLAGPAGSALPATPRAPSVMAPPSRAASPNGGRAAPDREDPDAVIAALPPPPAVELADDPPVVTPPPALALPAEADAPAARAAASIAVDSLEVDRSAVKDVLAAYRKSYNDLDAAAVSAIWKGVDERALQRAFSSLSRQNLSFERCDVRVPGADRAVARCEGVLSYVPKFGDALSQQRRMTWNMDFRRAGERWMIVGVNAR